MHYIRRGYEIGDPQEENPDGDDHQQLGNAHSHLPLYPYLFAE